MALLAALLLSSCSGKPPEPPKPWVETTQSERECADELKKQLRDPDSFQPEETKRVRQDKADSQAGTVVFGFRARNGFGGYSAGAVICERKKSANGYTVSATLIEQ